MSNMKNEGIELVALDYSSTTTADANTCNLEDNKWRNSDQRRGVTSLLGLALELLSHASLEGFGAL